MGEQDQNRMDDLISGAQNEYQQMCQEIDWLKEQLAESAKREAILRSLLKRARYPVCEADFDTSDLLELIDEALSQTQPAEGERT